MAKLLIDFSYIYRLVDVGLSIGISPKVVKVHHYFKPIMLNKVTFRTIIIFKLGECNLISIKDNKKFYVPIKQRLVAFY